LIAVTVIFTLLHGQPIKIRQTISELLMMQNYTGALWNHTWSLAVEWHFYLLLAITLFFLLKAFRNPEQSLRLIPWIFVACAVFCFTARVVSSALIESVGPQHFKWLYFGSHIRLDSLMFGVLLGYLWHFHGLKSRISRVPSVVLLAVGVALFAPAFMFEVETHRPMSVAGYSLFYVASGFLVLAAVRLESGSGKLIMFLAALGGASYSIYLWHMAVNRWLWPWMRDTLSLSLGGHYYLYMFVFIMGSIGLGFWLNRLVEKPSLRLREALFPRAKVSAVTSG
jgi:peptidoglycan/LPS O-acetylase OafA/YrhL